MTTRLEPLGNHSMLHPTTPSTETQFIHVVNIKELIGPDARHPTMLQTDMLKVTSQRRLPAADSQICTLNDSLSTPRQTCNINPEISDPFVFVGIVCTGVLRCQSHRDDDSDSPKQPRDHLNTNSPKQPRDHLNGWYRRPISIELNQPPLSPSSAGYRS